MKFVGRSGNHMFTGFFSALFALISAWIDPVTTEKIRVFKGDFLDSLLELVDRDQIPRELGGDMAGVPWHWPYAEASGVSPSQLRAHADSLTAKNESKIEQDSELRLQTVS